MSEHMPDVYGIDLDAQTRCLHYHSRLDIVAIRMKCCGLYYACRECHDAVADHAPKVWPLSEWDQKAVLCGACGTELTVRQYLDSSSRCPQCAASFNPGCQNHAHLYFETIGSSDQSV